METSKLKSMKFVPTHPGYITNSEIPSSKISLKIFNRLTKSYNNLIIDPFSQYFETIPAMMKPISSINDYYQMDFVNFKKNYIEHSVADFYFGEKFTKPEQKLVQIYDLKDLSIFIDYSKFKMLTHKNFLTENKRLNQDMKFYFVNAQSRNFIFQYSGGVNRHGDRIVKIKNLDELSVA
jgi:hypothetical protein